MHKSQTDAVKEWLMAYVRDEREIDEELERIREIRGRATSIKAQEITDMPKGKGSDDPMLDYVIRVGELESRVQRLIDLHERDRAAIVGLVNMMPDADERNVITYHYLYDMDWNTVLLKMYANMGEAQRRKMYRKHDKALEWIWKNWK